MNEIYSSGIELPEEFDRYESVIAGLRTKRIDSETFVSYFILKDATEKIESDTIKIFHSVIQEIFWNVDGENADYKLALSKCARCVNCLAGVHQEHPAGYARVKQWKREFLRSK